MNILGFLKRFPLTYVSDQTKLYKRLDELERTKIEDGYSHFPQIVQTAFKRGEKSFLTLADNIFYTALKEKPQLLKQLKKRLDRVLSLYENPHQKDSSEQV